MGIGRGCCILMNFACHMLNLCAATARPTKISPTLIILASFSFSSHNQHHHHLHYLQVYKLLTIHLAYADKMHVPFFRPSRAPRAQMYIPAAYAQHSTYHMLTRCLATQSS